MLEGRHIELRAWQEDDLHALSKLRNDLDLQNLLLAQARPNSLERLRRWVIEKSGQENLLFFVIASRVTGQCIGYVQLANIHPLHRTAELGICIAREQQGKGIGLDVLRVLEVYAVKVFALRKIVLHVLAEQGAAGFYLKAGYAEVGLLSQHVYQNGHYRDVLVMERLLQA